MALPLSRATPERLAAVRLLATDVDGTMTSRGKLHPDIPAWMERLAQAGIEVVPVTGRSAGEALALARYLPGVQRALAENGAVVVQPDRPAQLLHGAADRGELEARMRLLDPSLQPAPCAPFRLADLAFERESRTEAQLQSLSRRAVGAGLQLTWSSVHVHASRHAPDKGEGLRLMLGVDHPPERIATIGDARNDAGLWNRLLFGVTVGTAEVASQLETLPSTPEFLSGPGVDGWLELVSRLIEARG